MGVLLVIQMGVLLVNMYLQSIDMKMDIELQGLFHPVIILMIVMNISLWEITMEGIPPVALVRIFLKMIVRNIHYIKLLLTQVL
jgi:hypothetical protein